MQIVYARAMPNDDVMSALVIRDPNGGIMGGVGCLHHLDMSRGFRDTSYAITMRMH